MIPPHSDASLSQRYCLKPTMARGPLTHLFALVFIFLNFRERKPCAALSELNRLGKGGVPLCLHPNPLSGNIKAFSVLLICKIHISDPILCRLALSNIYRFALIKMENENSFFQGQSRYLFSIIFLMASELMLHSLEIISRTAPSVSFPLSISQSIST